MLSHECLMQMNLICFFIALHRIEQCSYVSYLGCTDVLYMLNCFTMMIASNIWIGRDLTVTTFFHQCKHYLMRTMNEGMDESGGAVVVFSFLSSIHPSLSMRFQLIIVQKPLDIILITWNSLNSTLKMHIILAY